MEVQFHSATDPYNGHTHFDCVTFHIVWTLFPWANARSCFCFLFAPTPLARCKQKGYPKCQSADKLHELILFSGPMSDSNRRPSECKSDALPTELMARKIRWCTKKPRLPFAATGVSIKHQPSRKSSVQLSRIPATRICKRTVSSGCQLTIAFEVNFQHWVLHNSFLGLETPLNVGFRFSL